MISMLHLLWMLPVAAFVGVLTSALLGANANEERRMRRDEKNSRHQ